jgi:hypothetical protein
LAVRRNNQILRALDDRDRGVHEAALHRIGVFWAAKAANFSRTS